MATRSLAQARVAPLAARALVLTAVAGGAAVACVHIPQNVHDTFEPWQPGEPGNFRPGAKKAAWAGPVDVTAPDAGDADANAGDAGDVDPEAHGAEPELAPADAAAPDAASTLDGGVS